ncbi:MAG TPA: hypothetical protein VMZ53_08080, partial [Kofleriaceae bacterium]|nr:hypothetical protein [Kofleriaceae bacterium]
MTDRTTSDRATSNRATSRARVIALFSRVGSRDSNPANTQEAEQATVCPLVSCVPSLLAAVA